MGANITSGLAMPVSVKVLVAEHIAAIADHQRLFELQDWGLAGQEDVSEALGPVDDILLEICGSRPVLSCERELRQRYLLATLPEYVFDDRARATSVLMALLR